MEGAPLSGWYIVASEYSDRQNPEKKFFAGQMILASVSGENTQLYNPDKDISIEVETDTFEKDLKTKKFTPARNRD